MSRSILHCDLNNFFASVECVRHPEWKDRPVAVCGSVKERHGICLAKNYPAKKYGIRTGDTVIDVLKKCPDAILAEPHYEEYEKYSRLTQAIYEEYTDRVEPFGCDESWLDVTGSTLLFGDARQIADTIRERTKRELGLTISVGVSFNKIFAKLGSDLKKPDAVTCITEDNFRERIWQLPACEMMGVGPATYRALQKRCIRTIGQIAQTPPGHLRTWLGKNGDTLWRYANGLDTAEVIPCARAAPMQSISRGMTPLRDMENEAECAAFLTEMAQEVGRRLRKNRLYAGGVKISIRDTKLCSREFQCTLATPTMHTDVIAQAAVQLLKKHYRWQNPLRSASVTAIQLTTEHTPAQMDILYDPDGSANAAVFIFAIKKLNDKYYIQLGLAENQSKANLEATGEGLAVYAVMTADKPYAVSGARMYFAEIADQAIVDELMKDARQGAMFFEITEVLPLG